MIQQPFGRIPEVRENARGLFAPCMTALAMALAGADGAIGAGPHGGIVEKSQSYQFEAVFSANGLKLYALGADGKPLDAAKLTGDATFYHPNSPEPWFKRSLKPASPGAGKRAPSLDLNMRLNTVPAAGVKVMFEIAGLPEPNASSASFTVPLMFAAAPVPPARTAPAPITYGRATRADQTAINAQRVCKVSGEPLGSMGGPIKVTRGVRSVYLCCQSCLRAIAADPDRYFGPSPATGNP